MSQIAVAGNYSDYLFSGLILMIQNVGRIISIYDFEGYA